MGGGGGERVARAKGWVGGGCRGAERTSAAWGGWRKGNERGGGRRESGSRGAGCSGGGGGEA